MAVSVDQDQKWLVDCLSATLDTNQEVRSFAEASLQQASLQPGFGAALAKVAANKELPFGLRQLAAVILKQFIKQHWKEDEENFVHPVVSTPEKASIRQLLISSLDDSNGKIHTAIGMAISFIATYDWPEDWPELLPFLLKLISDRSNTNGVHGALRCLALISGDLDDTLVPTLVPVLFPYLHGIVSAPNIYGKKLRAKAISIVHSCTSILGSMSGIYQAETRALMAPMLKSWMEQFSIVLQTSVQAEDPEDWNLKMEVLKCLLQFIQNFPTLVDAEFSVVVAPFWQTILSCSNKYQVALVQGADDPYLGKFDSDGVEKSLESFAIQMFEFLLTVVGNFRLAGVIESKVEDLLYYTILFLQITEEQVKSWSTDANQYVADEDDATYSCRVSGSLLLEEIINIYGKGGMDSLLRAAEKHHAESCNAKVQGSGDWWKVHEACLFALCSISDPLLEEQSSGSSRSIMADLLNKMLMEGKDSGVHDYPFVHARAFVTAAKFSSVINQGLHEHFIYTAIQAISLDVPPPVKVGACQALSHLLPDSKLGFTQTQIVGLLSALLDLLNQASEETLHLVLETLQAAVKAGHEFSTAIEPVLSPVILNLWVKHVSDPFISIDALEVLEAIKNSPGCMWPLACRILPSIGPMLEKPHEQPAGLVAGSFDLLTMMLKGAPSDVVKGVFETCFHFIVRIILQSDDHGEMQNATECLAVIVSGGKQELLVWSNDPMLTMKSLLDAASRLLDPGVESSASLFVGSYILQLILHFPSEIVLHVRELITALVRRMQSSEIAGLKNSIIVILARLVHLSCPNVGKFIDLLLTIPANGYDSSLAYVMSEWTKQQGEIQGAYQIKITTVALALLLSTKHTEIAKINVQGQLVKSNAGITTRSKAKANPDKWSVVPLPVKIFALLADTLIEIQEKVLPDKDEDSDWEAEEGDTIQKDILFSSGLSSSSRLPMEHLEVMAKVFNENDGDDDCEDDLVKGVDPLNEINLPHYLADFFTKLSNNERPLFEQLFHSLSPVQRKAVEAILYKQVTF